MRLLQGQRISIEFVPCGLWRVITDDPASPPWTMIQGSATLFCQFHQDELKYGTV
jgi:hypothetical protein